MPQPSWWHRPWLVVSVYLVDDSAEQLVAYLAEGTAFGSPPGDRPTAGGRHRWSGRAGGTRSRHVAGAAARRGPCGVALLARRRHVHRLGTSTSRRPSGGGQSATTRRTGRGSWMWGCGRMAGGSSRTASSWTSVGPRATTAGGSGAGAGRRTGPGVGRRRGELGLGQEGPAAAAAWAAPSLPPAWDGEPDPSLTSSAGRVFHVKHPPMSSRILDPW